MLTFVALGGAGKTSLVAKFAAQLAKKERNYDDTDYFDWSFYSQGSRDHSIASADEFVDRALRFFDDEAMADSAKGPWEKGTRLAELLARRRALLVLDGIEPLQHPALAHEVKGQINDSALLAVLRGLAAKNAGLCVVTTRVPPVDLDNWRNSSAPRYSLARLSNDAGVLLLESLGVKGESAELAKTVEEVKGHALTLNLLGSYLHAAYGGDVLRRDQVDFSEADEENDDLQAFGLSPPTNVGLRLRVKKDGGSCQSSA